MSPVFMFVAGATLSAIVCGVLLLIARERVHVRLAQAERDRACLALAENVGSVATWMVDLRTQKVFWSDRVFAVHGRDKTAGTPPLAAAIDYYHPEDRERVRKTFDNAVMSGSPFHIDARIIDEQGVEKQIMSRGICTFGPDGKATELFGVLFEAPESKSFAAFGNEDLNTLALEEDYRADA
tara:strand:- start:316 stop:861 length:546 start_codon:yes stop_codon:yes gene_type:complete